MTATGLPGREARALNLARGGIQRVGAFSMLPALIAQVGDDPRAALASAGLAPEALAYPENWIPYASLAQLLHEVAERTGCAHFGLLVGRTWHLRDMGKAGEIVANCPTVGDGLRRLIAYQHLNSESAAPFMRETADVVDFGAVIYESGALGVDQLGNAYMASMSNIMRDLCGNGWKPSSVHLPYAQPRDVTHHRQLLRARLHFDADFAALRFPARWLQMRVRGADPERLLVSERTAAAMGRPQIVQQVRRVLRSQLLGGRSSGDGVAHALSLHRRTMHRRLAEAGTTFQSLLDQVRFDLACQLLAHSTMSLDDVAAVLGYAGACSFARRFHRLAGVSPGHWRRAFRSRPSNDAAVPAVARLGCAAMMARRSGASAIG
jgi:AraC-like DNA-binding protein